LGEPQEKPVAELRKYPSLSFFTHDQLSKPSVALSADDVLKFMQSDFARKGQYDEIFETELPLVAHNLPSTGSMLFANDLPAAGDGSVAFNLPTQSRVKQANVLNKQSTPPPSPRKIFSMASLARMRELEHNIDTNLVDAFDDSSDASRTKRRRLALTTACNITKVLFDANKLLLDAIIQR
jgi:hypothetical protein